MFNTVGIIGLGLIGGSFALEIKRLKLSENIIGFDEDQKSLDFALKNEIIDGYASLNEIGICDFVIVATPSDSIASILKTIFSKVKKGTIIIDVGSVKNAIIKQIKEYLPKDICYIPTHPIAGIEKYGIEASRKDLFKGAYFIITPLENTNNFSLKKVENFAESLGMKVEKMDAEKHDETFAYISHLPHLIAYALVGMVESKKEKNFKFIGGGFKDFTRIASSSEKMWCDIFKLNKDMVIKSVDEFINELNKVKDFIKNDEEGNMLEYFGNARGFKESLDV